MSRCAVLVRRGGVLFSFSVAAVFVVMGGLKMVMCRSVMARGGGVVMLA
jgi:hypothetical protein